MALNLDYVDLRITCPDLVFNTDHNEWLKWLVQDALSKMNENHNYNVEVVEPTKYP